MNLRKSARGQDCQVRGCKSAASCRGYCQKHYTRLLRTGSPTTKPYSVRSKNPRKRFMKKIMPVPESGCWIWMQSVATTGYGKAHHMGKHISAHRLSHVLFIGPIPDGAHVLHSCDVRCCVNPDHLRAGTHQENVNDAVERHRIGKLSRDDVLNIRADGRTTRVIGSDYGISGAQVSEIKRGKAWANIT